MAVETLKISEEKKKYITEVLNPILELLVSDCLGSMPDPPEPYILDWLRQRSGDGSSSGGQSKEDLEMKNKELKDRLKRMENTTEEVQAEFQKQMPENDKDEEEEEEDDGADDVDELPEAPISKVPRASVSAEAYGAWNQKQAYTPKVHAKTDEQKSRLRGVLDKSFLFSSLEPKEMNQVIDAMEEKVCEVSERPIKQGDDGDFLFVIESGLLDCLVKKEGAEEVCVKTCEPGDAFGELALLYNCPRAASVEAKEKCTLWQLDREAFNHIVKDAAQKKRDRYEAFLNKVPLLATLGSYEKSQVADALKCENVEAGVEVVVENDPGDKFYIVEEGELEAYKAGEKVMDYKAGDYFGELALLRNQPRAATVKASGPAQLLYLDRRTFKRLLGPLEALLMKKTYA